MTISVIRLSDGFHAEACAEGMSPGLDSRWGGSFPLPGRESHPLEAPGFAWRTEVFRQIGVDYLGVPRINRLMDLSNRIERAPPRAIPVDSNQQLSG
jgi:hypothetical protein